MAGAGAGLWPPALPLVTLAAYAVDFGLAAAKWAGPAQARVRRVTLGLPDGAALEAVP